MPQFKTLANADFTDKIVLVRQDPNVPFKDGKISDNTRLVRGLPTLRALVKMDPKAIVLLAHLGRPKGKPNPEMSLAPLAKALGELLGTNVTFGSNCVGPEAKAAIEKGGLIMLENLRFHQGETTNDAEFAANLAALGDVYVNDAFSVSHRSHASVEGITKHLPSYAGLLMEEELSALEAALDSPKRPMAAVVGGAKVSTKIDLLTNLVGKVDKLVIGGGMANTFIAAQGHNVGKSLCEHDLLDTAREVMAKAEATGCHILLPTDALVAKEFGANVPYQVLPVDQIPDDGIILDIGPASIQAISDGMANWKSLVWNGPMGAFEISPFDQGTVALAKQAATLTKTGSLLTVAGGGDTVAALIHAGVEDDFTYVSTAGGAFLEWLEGKILPGVAALAD